MQRPHFGSFCRCHVYDNRFCHCAEYPDEAGGNRAGRRLNIRCEVLPGLQIRMLQKRNIPTSCGQTASCVARRPVWDDAFLIQLLSRYVAGLPTHVYLRCHRGPSCITSQHLREIAQHFFARGRASSQGWFRGGNQVCFRDAAE